VLDSPSEAYRRYVSPKVQSDTIFDRGRQVLSIKVLPATAGVKEAQEKLSPGHGFEYKSQLRQVVIAAGFPNAGDFSPQDLKISLGGRNFEWIHEIGNAVIDETHYFYAYPFHRIFLVDFSNPESENFVEELEIRSPRGRLTFNVNFQDEKL